MKKYFFKVFGYFILSVVIVGMSFAMILQQKRINEKSHLIGYLQNENNELRKLKTYHFEAKLYVTDKSKTTLYGRNNKGQMIAPSVKTYELKFDSTNFNMFVLPEDKHTRGKPRAQ